MHGHHRTDTFYMPPGVKRGVPAAEGGKVPKCRVDFFDSVKQVLSAVQVSSAPLTHPSFIPD